MWSERRGLGFGIGVGLLRRRGFRVLRKAMAVDCGALEGSGGRIHRVCLWVLEHPLLPPPYNPRYLSHHGRELKGQSKGTGRKTI